MAIEVPHGYNPLTMHADVEYMFHWAKINEDDDSTIGFVGDNIKDKFKNSLVFGHERLGRGNMIYFTDNIMFRSFWENGKLFLVNSIFFVN